MGTCATKEEYKARFSYDKAPSMTCPICQAPYDSKENLPYSMCRNGHGMCKLCLDSLVGKAKQKGQRLRCPFCKIPCPDRWIYKDDELVEFLHHEQGTLEKMPQNMKKLYIFASLYLPKLRSHLKESYEKGGKDAKRVQGIQTISITNKMNEQYEVLELQMFDCLPKLKSLTLNNNQIKALDSSGLLNSSLLVLDVSDNNISSVNALLAEGANAFKGLKVLNLKNNMIEQIGGLKHVKYLESLDLSGNKIKRMNGLQQAQRIRHLNLQFNQINCEYHHFPFFTRIMSLRLFGNNLTAPFWEAFLKESWKELRVLSVSVRGVDLLQKSAMFQRIFDIDQKFLKAIIYESFFEEKQNFPEHEGDPLEEQGITCVELYESTYKVYIEERESFLSHLIDKAKWYHPCGRNINFVSMAGVNQTYSLDSHTWTYQKITEEEDYLYSREQLSKDQDTLSFVSVFSESQGIIVGVTETKKEGGGRSPFSELKDVNMKRKPSLAMTLASNKPGLYMEFDMEKQTAKGSGKYSEQFNMQSGQNNLHKTMVQIAPVDWTIDHEYLLAIHPKSRTLLLMVDGVPRHQKVISQEWQNFRFYIMLKEKGTEFRVNRFNYS